MYTYNIRSVVGVYTTVGVVTEWLWSVYSKLECILPQGKSLPLHASGTWAPPSTDLHNLQRNDRGMIRWCQH